MEFGERLRLLREKKKLSQIELAEKLGIPNQSISNYERGYRKPPFENLIKLADFFEVSIDYLLGRDTFIYKTDGPKNLDSFVKDGLLTYKGVPLDDKEIDQLVSILNFMVEYKKDKLGKRIKKREDDSPTQETQQNEIQ